MKGRKRRVSGGAGRVDAERKEKDDNKKSPAWRGSLPTATEPGASEGQEAREGNKGTRPRREQGANQAQETRALDKTCKRLERV